MKRTDTHIFGQCNNASDDLTPPDTHVCVSRFPQCSEGGAVESV